MKFYVLTLIALMLIGTACAPEATSTALPQVEAATVTEEIIHTATATAVPATPTLPPPTETFTPIPTKTPTQIAYVDSLKAAVTADKLVCRYGPGKNYLYLFGYVSGARLKLIGKAHGNNWVLVENEPQRCWVNAEFLSVEGDLNTLKPMYPDGYTIPVSPYYGGTTVLTAVRKGAEVTVTWTEVLVSPGKYEDENMFPYIVEIWTCIDGEIVFDTLGSTVPFITFTDVGGCAEPSHGRVYVQEKHGYGGPAEIPWP